MKYLDTLNNQLKNSDKQNFNEIFTIRVYITKSDNITKSNAINFVFKKILPDYK